MTSDQTQTFYTNGQEAVPRLSLTCRSLLIICGIEGRDGRPCKAARHTQLAFNSHSFTFNSHSPSFNAYTTLSTAFSYRVPSAFLTAGYFL
eukprot:scaffold14439_cov74-Skeletonema_dohrnii-CCMP3373.AAC.1